MSMEYRWNDADKGKPKNLEKNLSQCYFVNHKSHMDWTGLRNAAYKSFQAVR
jgi:hypothetical protein